MPAFLRTGLILIISLATLSACTFSPPIQQGNIIDEQAIARLEPGMTRDQVRFLLGTPVLQNPFRDDRWHYLYYISTRTYTEQQVFTVHFDGDRISRIERRIDQPVLEDG